MNAKIIHTPHAPPAIGAYSQAMLVGDILYSSGQIALDAKSGEMINGDITAQTQKVCENLAAVLHATKMDFTNVVKTMCFITTMEHFAAFNEVYAQFFIGKPARSCVAVNQLPRNALVEIEVIAVY